MRIAVTAQGADLDALVDLQFGRCPHFVIVNTEETEQSQLGTTIALPNPAVAASSGAGILAAQTVVEAGVQAVITGAMGPNAMEVFQAANIGVYSIGSVPASEGGLTVRQALQAFKAGRLTLLTEPSSGKGRSLVNRSSERSLKIAELRHKARQLREELAHILDEIDRLEKEQ